RARDGTSLIGRYVTRLLPGRSTLDLVGPAALTLLLASLAVSDPVIPARERAARAPASYMRLGPPDVPPQLIPAAALLAGLLAFAELARHSELTAIFAGGMSKVRLALAILPAIVLIAGGQFLIEDQARPAALKELRAWGIADYEADEDAGPTW